MEFIREDCIYARQSVDRKDSISIESQIDFCKYELKGGSCRVFKDKGYSGKNTDRPEFQKLLGEIRKGKVRRVIVYKLDRISRSILDFATMMELFQEYDVEFVSSTEKFDTSTPMGRAMLNICIVFAQLERETIQKRVTDAYYSRCLKGFHMSGQAPYGYQLEPTVVEGIRTKKMVADPVAADHVRLMFEMYAEPETSFGDITRYFEEHDIKIYGKSMFRTFLSQLLRNPVYAQADLELYEFFKSQGAAIVNDASDFAGTNGCYHLPHSLNIGNILDVDQILQRRAPAQADAVPAPKAVFADGQRAVYLVAVFLTHELQVARLNEFEVGQQVQLLRPCDFFLRHSGHTLHPVFCFSICFLYRSNQSNYYQSYLRVIITSPEV